MGCLACCVDTNTVCTPVALYCVIGEEIVLRKREREMFQTHALYLVLPDPVRLCFKVEPW